MSVPRRRGEPSPEHGDHEGEESAAGDPAGEYPAGEYLAGEHSAGDTVSALAAPELPAGERRVLLHRLVRHLPAGTLPRGRRWRPSAAAHALTDAVTNLAPHVPVRSLETLRAHYGGRDGDVLADRLVTHAARATAGVGAAAGGVAAVKWTVPPTLLTAPVTLAAETVAVAAIELKLIGELRTVYRVPVTGTVWQQAGTLVRLWSVQRGVDLLVPGVTGQALQTATRKRLTEQLTRRFGRNLPTLAPLLVGAAVAGYLNRRQTRALGRQVRQDLARQQGSARP